MLITGTTAREDGLPAVFYRTAKVIEVFKVTSTLVFRSNTEIELPEALPLLPLCGL
jgi:hypothetical protein